MNFQHFLLFFSLGTRGKRGKRRERVQRGKGNESFFLINNFGVGMCLTPKIKYEGPVGVFIGIFVKISTLTKSKPDHVSHNIIFLLFHFIHKTAVYGYKRLILIISPFIMTCYWCEASP